MGRNRGRNRVVKGIDRKETKKEMVRNVILLYGSVILRLPVIILLCFCYASGMILLCSFHASVLLLLFFLYVDVTVLLCFYYTSTIQKTVTIAMIFR